MTETVSEDVRGYTKLKYVGDCKCGQCQLVPLTVIISTADRLDALASELLTARRELAEAREALKPFADRVFNDNGDMTVSGVPPAPDFIRAYFVLRRRALQPQNQRSMT